MNGRWVSRLGYAAAGALILLLAYWLRNPLIPYGGKLPDASISSADSSTVDEAEQRRALALEALARAIRREEQNLTQIGSAALAAPTDAERAFDYLRESSLPPETGIILAGPNGPIAWDGQFRAPPSFTGPGVLVSFTPLYTTLQVVTQRDGRSAIASALIHADRPADRIAAGIADRMPERSLAGPMRFAPVSDTTAPTLISDETGRPLLRVDLAPLSNESIRFVRSATIRGWGAVVLGVILFVFLAVAWAERRALAPRLFAVAVALASIGLVPWNNFSNTTRLFDPAYFFSTAGGPFTANAGVFIMTSALVLVAVVGFIRARTLLIPRLVAGLASAILLVAGAISVRAASDAIVLPRWGATSSLWVSWQLPIFLILFAMVLGAFWLLRVARRETRLVQLRTAALIALGCGAIATFMVWTRSTEQRLQLAMRDVAGLERPDPDLTQLLTRFGSQLSGYDSVGSRSSLLQRFAASDLAAAGLQVSLRTWTANGTGIDRIDLADFQYDSVFLSSLVREAVTDSTVIVREPVGPAGRQVMLAVSHDSGGVTTVVASPRTRLIGENPYLSLLGFDQPDRTEPPYTLTLANVSPGGSARSGSMTWRRVENEWHGDELIETSLGVKRAHVEVDLRSWPTRIVRATLMVILDVVVAGLLWALATMTERGFFRWVRSRFSRWMSSYRGRLTLALFAFFVVPAVGFAGWSYQRLQRDDRGVRELLVHEILSASVAESDSTTVALTPMNAAPLFRYTDGILTSSSDPLFEIIAPAGRMLPRRAYINLSLHGELISSARQTIAGSTMVWGFRAAPAPVNESAVLAAPARSDEIVLDRRRRDITLLVLFATAVGAIAAFWLSGFAARILARDLELAKVEVARAERVIAWGEMARQVAHEIKNPLTPIRLGVQHLRRARSDSRIDFDKVLDENVTRILSEIDRLDKIARTFSRYGSAPGELPPAEEVDVAAILRDVVALERMGIGGVEWTLAGADAPVTALARKDELRDVLLNVFENSRLARARKVNVALSRDQLAARIVIEDDGAGIEAEAMPRVFEPHFSTRTTGSGLGLAISRRLIESWGGTIDLSSEKGRGARVMIRLQVGPA